jgi:hypothetical protein
MLHEQAVNPALRTLSGTWWLIERHARVCTVGIWEKRVRAEQFENLVRKLARRE